MSIGLDKEKKNLVLLVKGQGFQAAFQFGPEEAADLTVRLARLTQELAPRRSPIVVPQKNGPPIVSQAGNLRFPR